MAIRMVGRIVTETRNQLCSANSDHENRRWTMAPTVDHTASKSMAKRSPRSARAATTLRPALRIPSIPHPETSAYQRPRPLSPTTPMPLPSSRRGAMVSPFLSRIYPRGPLLNQQ